MFDIFKVAHVAPINIHSLTSSPANPWQTNRTADFARRSHGTWSSAPRGKPGHCSPASASADTGGGVRPQRSYMSTDKETEN